LAEAAVSSDLKDSLAGRQAGRGVVCLKDQSLQHRNSGTAASSGHGETMRENDHVLPLDSCGCIGFGTGRWWRRDN